MSAVAAQPKRILMVDDDVALLRVVREALVASLRCEVDTSPKPEYAFELALKKKYDLLIFDFQMPMIDGAILVREALVASLRCEVDTSPKPEYAFERALKKKYDLLIFDFQMPMIDGAMLFFLIGKVYQNSQPVREVPPLLLISGKAEEERAQDLFK